MLATPKIPAEQLRDHFQDPTEAAYACIRDGHLSRLQALLSASSPGPIVSHVHPEFGSPLHFAAACGNLDAVELLLAARADPLLIYKPRRFRPIGCAARNGHREVVNYLWSCVSREDQVKGLGSDDATPLCGAAAHGHALIVEDLLSWDGWSKGQRFEALIWAASAWHYDAAALLLGSDTLDSDSTLDVLYITVDDRMLLRGSVRLKFDGFDYINQQLLIELLIGPGGADPNLCGPGELPLVSRAASNANLTMALKTLLSKGADPNKQHTPSGESALHILASPVPVGCASDGRQVINSIAIELLIQHGASVTLPNKQGDSPIHLAAFGCDLRSFRLFLSPSPLRDMQEDEDTLLALTTVNKETLLHYAAAGGRVDIIDYLVSRGLDVNAKSSSGWTPLMCALIPTYITPPSDSGMAVVIKTPANATRAALCLLSHGADPCTTTAEGWTLLHALALHCNLDIGGNTAELATQFITRGVDPAARAPLLTHMAASDPDHLGMPWGHRLRDAMMNPSARRMFMQPCLTPLHWAAQRGAVGVVKAVLAANVDVLLTDASGMSPVAMAHNSKVLALRNEAANAIVCLLVGAGAAV